MSAVPKEDPNGRATLIDDHQWVRLAPKKQLPQPLAHGDLALQIGNDKSARIYRNTNRMIFGRRVPDTRPYDAKFIDLTAYLGTTRGVSRLHAVISRNQEGDGYVLADLGSKNGTYLNGRKLRPKQICSLSNGDILQLGNLDVFFFCATSKKIAKQIIALTDDKPTTSNNISPAYLADELFAFLSVLTDIQELINTMKGDETNLPHVDKFAVIDGYHAMEAQVSGMEDATAILQSLLSPWKNRSEDTEVKQLRVLKGASRLMDVSQFLPEYDISTTPIPATMAVSSRQGTIVAYQALRRTNSTEFVLSMAVVRQELAIPIVNQFASELPKAQQTGFVENLLPLLFAYLTSTINVK